MTTLFVITKISPLLVSVLLREFHDTAGDVIIAATDKHIADVLSPLGLDTINIFPNLSKQTRKEKDTHFGDIAMEGTEHLAFDIPDTDLPVWKCVSLDRLYYFNWGDYVDQCLSSIDSLSYDNLYVSLDIENPLSFVLLRDYDATGVQSESMRTREYLDLAPFIPAQRLIIGRLNAPIGVLNALKGEIHLYTTPAIMPIPAPQRVDREIARKGLRVEPDSKVALIVVDLQSEYYLRKFLVSSTLKVYDHVLVYFPSVYARFHFLRVCKDFVAKDGVTLIDDLSLVSAVDASFLFRYDEILVPQCSGEINIMDVHDRFKSAVVSQS